jgi:hypothetical protein
MITFLLITLGWLVIGWLSWFWIYKMEIANDNNIKSMIQGTTLGLIALILAIGYWFEKNKPLKDFWNKKIFLLPIGLLLFISCSHNPHVDQVKANYLIKEIDSCEYIIYSKHSGYKGYGFMAHKGNCKYCNKLKHYKNN